MRFLFAYFAWARFADDSCFRAGRFRAGRFRTGRFRAGGFCRAGRPPCFGIRASARLFARARDAALPAL